VNIYLFQILNGLGIGMIYFLLSVGLTIIFGLLGFVNFAHGAFYLLGAYLCYALVVETQSFWLALLAAPLAVALLGWLLDRFLLNRVYSLPHSAHILITFGIALILQETIILLFGTLSKNVPVPEWLSGVVIVGSFVYPEYRLFTIGISAVVAIILWFLLERTRFGAVLRAGSQSTEMVSLLGINIFRVFSLTFAFGSWLAGVAGVIAAPLRGVDPFMSVEALAIAFVVVVVGGLGSFTGALVGALVIGVVQSVMSSLWPEAARLMIYAAMAAVILVKPHGLFGRA
jgi:branched-chain amino acid transport system permease protein